MNTMRTPKQDLEDELNALFREAGVSKDCRALLRKLLEDALKEEHQTGYRLGLDHGAQDAYLFTRRDCHQ